ncbi:MAG: TetR/AcrR family transcriptional regulator [Clostridia bacterium]|nr:TetR/AcrR family transcriptional regulator [Clostridia bacterium]
MSASGDNNRSVRFTKVRIRTAFFELIKEKNIQKITVAEIVRRADISRATFYLHYFDIYDLLKQTEDDIIFQVIEEIKKFDESTYVVGEFPIAKRVFEVFNSHSEELELIFGENGDASFRDKIQTAISDYFKELLSLIVPDNKSLDNVLCFLVGGILNMFLSNLRSENPSDINTLAMISNRYLRATNVLIGIPEVENDK